MALRRADYKPEPILSNSMTSYGIIMPQWINACIKWPKSIFLNEVC